MTNKPILDGEAGENLFAQMLELYWADALEERGLSISEMWAAQVIFINPFKKGQFSGLKGEDNEYEARINEEVEAVAIIENAKGEPIQAGDKIRQSDIGAVKEIREIPDYGDNVGHVTFIRTASGQLHGEFNFIYNESYVPPLLEAANEFISAAEHARENNHWRAFVENTFHASERLMKAHVIQHGKPAFNHAALQSSYDIFVQAGTANSDLLHVNRELYNKYRTPGSYVDPSDHPNGIDEIEFDLDPNIADRWLELIVDHRDNVNE